VRIQVVPEACTGCRLCRQVCAIEKMGQTNPRLSRLRVEALFPAPGRYVPHVCDQCGACADACPNGAISCREDGVYVVDAELCTSCGACYDACPEEVLMEGADEVPFKCDYCWACTEVCNTGALMRAD
jgi:Fe-S-cluster-containing hydrogenase component 2